ncbi:MAG: hypothetical protein JRH06_04620 [Deltaproteobacteria bacterium]|nr:hypothetical protein [Deltaproteobacteria bacterium]MBW2136824.1 hypothetical protein [Deltaproteobacteria bacterium]
MEEKEDQSKEITEEDLIDFELEDLDFEGEGGDTVADTDEEILELVDLVEKGEKEREEGQEEPESLIEEEEPGDSEEEIEFSTDELSDLTGEFDKEPGGETEYGMNLSDLSLSDLTLEDESEEEMEEVQDSELEIEGLLEEDATEAIDFGVEEKGAEKAEGTTEGEVTERELEAMLEEAPTELVDLELEGAERQGAGEIELKEVEEPAGEPSRGLEGSVKEEGATAELAKESQPEGMGEEVELEDEPREELKVSEAIAAVSEAPPPEEIRKEAEVAGVGLQALTEEKIEEIVTRVVSDVLERVTRETMAEVAERVIKEAIETLRESIKSRED